VLLGKFRFERRIGAGGMGVVYQAVDLALGRTVAIKTLPQLSPEYATRLRREARAMAAVSHPNLAPIFGAETWRGTPMLVCEFLRGGTLAGRLRTGWLGIDEALTVAVSIAAAVEYIHGVGILHCDIKPSNIGFTDERSPKLLDFGLARIAQDVPLAVFDPVATTQSASQAIAMSPTGLSGGSGTHHLIGTPLYMAPEAIRGERPSDIFDLWGVAVVLFEMLTGQTPYRGQTVPQIYEAIARGPVPDVRALRSDCPAALAVFLQGALSADRGRRPANARALTAVLQDLRMSCRPV
jgi:serine/threonine-protein kinase